MTRAVVNVATGRYVIGQNRLVRRMREIGLNTLTWSDTMPEGSPDHRDNPYAFKAHALAHAQRQGVDLLLWADACIVPARSLDLLWERIERDGYWMSNNGWSNYSWTAENAYPLLGITPEENREIPHVVATTFGLNLRHEKGAAFLAAYLDLAKSGAFIGPWWNANSPEYGRNKGAAPCGPADVHGHRHDQTAASVIAYMMRWALTNPPDVFAYRGGETGSTLLIADGNY